MKGKIWGWVTILLFATLFAELKFNQISAFNRDLLQYLNSNSPPSKLLTTIDIDIRSNDLNYPLDLNSLEKVLGKLQQFSPKAVILAIEPRDLTPDTIERKKILQYLIKHNNLFLNGLESSDKLQTFRIDPLFKSYPRFFDFIIPTDKFSGPQDSKNRRAILSFKHTGPVTLIKNLRSIGLQPKPISYFEYRYSYLETEQAFIKSYRPEKFHNLNTNDLFSEKFNKAHISDKIVIVGSNNEFSFLTLPSVFNLFNNSSLDIKSFAEPYQHTVANLINFHIQGEYIKYIRTSYVIYLLAILYALIIFSKANIKNKLILSAALLPTTLTAQLIVYLASDIYIDISDAIAFSLFFHYLILPVLIFYILRKYEQKKAIDIAHAKLQAQTYIAERVAHDIRSPLSAVKLLLSRAQFDNSEIKDIVYSSLDRIDSTADKILSKDSKNISTSHEKWLIHSLISSIIVEKKILHDWITYDLDCAPELAHVTVAATQLDIHRVLNNIYDNSIHALIKAKNPKIITQIIQSHSSHVSIVITDNGPGIPPHIVPLIGKERISTKTNSSGIGVGLLHSKKAIELLGGDLKINSTSAGTSVSIRLNVQS